MVMFIINAIDNPLFNTKNTHPLIIIHPARTKSTARYLRIKKKEKLSINRWCWNLIDTVDVFAPTYECVFVWGVCVYNTFHQISSSYTHYWTGKNFPSMTSFGTTWAVWVLGEAGWQQSKSKGFSLLNPNTHSITHFSQLWKIRLIFTILNEA